MCTEHLCDVALRESIAAGNDCTAEVDEEETTEDGRTGKAELAALGYCHGCCGSMPKDAYTCKEGIWRSERGAQVAEAIRASSNIYSRSLFEKSKCTLRMYHNLSLSLSLSLHI